MIVPEQVIQDVLNEVVERFLKPKFIELGMNASGDWLRSLEVRTSLNRGEIWGKYYSYWLSEGRGPNHNQSPESIGRFVGWAGSAFLRQWCIDKGIDPKLSYAIAYKIAKEGTDYYPNGTDLIDVLQSSEVTQFINNKIGEYILQDTQLRITKMIKDTLITA